MLEIISKYRQLLDFLYLYFDKDEFVVFDYRFLFLEYLPPCSVEKYHDILMEFFGPKNIKIFLDRSKGLDFIRSYEYENLLTKDISVDFVFLSKEEILNINKFDLFFEGFNFFVDYESIEKENNLIVKDYLNIFSLNTYDLRSEYYNRFLGEKKSSREILDDKLRSLKRILYFQNNIKNEIKYKTQEKKLSNYCILPAIFKLKSEIKLLKKYIPSQKDIIKYIYFQGDLNCNIFGDYYKGKICIIGNNNDLYFDILVGYDVDNFHFNLLEKAKLIIVEESTLLTHAIYMCREIGKPIIYGAEYLYEVLDDGDYVEIDFKQKIIKKN
ncbi:PEP-utilizing enzyme [Candidatus Absconditicoccus praedator]|uniref:PEP-utilizing enzyme n=1 Tax=Candidatus Absconditicoccus praedator TaxID=2735562 RepID=UPI001E2CA967|nr:PEP-utilizing enzyme [Candidatus Absconditicoccus praedator]UFX83299.1 hypothetical protein HLG78_04170 [Candidatus Absconditicoccus praedator]